MRKGGGNSKGGAFERKIAVQLSEWMSDGEHKDWFWRTAMSGGRATVFAKKGISLKNQVGDICAIDENSFKFSKTFMIECKNYKDVGLKNLITGTENKLPEWWEKLWGDADAVDKIPLLVFKQSRMSTLVMMKLDGLAAFRISKRKLFNSEIIVAWYPQYCAYIFYWDDLLENTNPNRVKFNE